MGDPSGDKGAVDVAMGFGGGDDAPPNQTVYVSNLNERLKVDGTFTHLA